MLSFFPGEFGNGVLSYFLFLKSLFILNIIIFVIVFSFLSVPQIAKSYNIFQTAVPTTAAPANMTVNMTSSPGNVSALSLSSTPASNGSFAKLSGSQTCIQPSAMKDSSKKELADQVVDFITGQVILHYDFVLIYKISFLIILGS